MVPWYTFCQYIFNKGFELPSPYAVFKSEIKIRCKVLLCLMHGLSLIEINEIIMRS